MEAGIPVYQPVKVREDSFVSMMAEWKPDAVIVAAFGQLLPKSILDIPRYGCINVHASLLPKYRGAAPIQWAVINGEKESGITVMLMNEGLDTGDMLKKAAVPIDKKETGDSLHDKLSVLGGGLILEVLGELETGTAVRTPQKEEDSCYAGMLKKEMGAIDFSLPAENIERLIRGLNSWPSAYTHVNGKTLKIWEAEVLEEEHEGAYGEIVGLTRDALYVKTGKGTLSLLEVQLEGKKRMSVDAFLRGYLLEKGMRLN